MNDKKNKIFLAAVGMAALIWAGGYFVYISCALLVPLLAYTVYLCFQKNSFTLCMDWNMAALLLVVIFYLITPFWAVNAQMAVWGFFKFLPVLLFYLILCQGEYQEWLIERLPPAGCFMTVCSFILMQFEIFQKYTSVAGRLAGFFQYSNTYAVFMLVCAIVTGARLEREGMRLRHMVYLVTAVAGIFLSGSRTTFVLMVLAAVAFILKNKKARRILLPMAVIGVLLSALLLALGYGNTAFMRFTDISLNSSTLLGRFLYYKDAIPVILRHPFGLGYYGYYSIEQQIQTGVYAVLHVHNELLQLMLDIGWLPALAFYGAIIRSMVAKGITFEYRIALLMLLLHSLLDYDFQFTAMAFVLLLFLKIGKNVKIPCPWLARAGASIAGMAVLVFATLIGVSDYSANSGNYQQALKFYGGNVRALEGRLQQAQTAEEMESAAQRLLDVNENNALANSAMARVAYHQGRIDAFIYYKEKALELMPYQYQEYQDYMDRLHMVFTEYMKMGDTESAGVCVERMEGVFMLLEEVKEKTSDIAWKIRDIPQVTLPQEYIELLNEDKAKLQAEAMPAD